MKKVLFICTENACRSQMAEGFLRALGGDRFDVTSAGTEPAAAVNPDTIAAMAEVGIDISQQRPKRLAPLLGHFFTHVITVCDPPSEPCPIFPGVVQRLKWVFPDPGKASGSDEQRMRVFRKVRDDIADHVRGFVESEDALS